MPPPGVGVGIDDGVPGVGVLLAQDLEAGGGELVDTSCIVLVDHEGLGRGGKKLEIHEGELRLHEHGKAALHDPEEDEEGTEEDRVGEDAKPRGEDALADGAARARGGGEGVFVGAG